MERILLGKGVLSWESPERRSDRYGTVFLMGEGANSFSTEESPIELENVPEEGQYGKLIAVVTEARRSTHIGDLFHGFIPSTPNVGEEIILGDGELFYDEQEHEYYPVGLKPKDGRNSFWLNSKALYKAHEQSVELYFEKQ